MSAAAAFQGTGSALWQVLPVLAVVGGTFVLVAAVVVAISLCFVRNPVFKLMYYVYAHTPLGQLIHDFQLSSHAKSAAEKRARHLDAADAAEAHATSSAMHSALTSFSVHFPVKANSRHGLASSVLPIPVMGDNYQYLVLTPADVQDVKDAGLQVGTTAEPRLFHAVAVDVSNADLLLAVMAALETESNITIILSHVLTTHRHMDHCGGHRKLMDVWSSRRNSPPPDIVAPLLDPTPGVTIPVRDGDSIALLPPGSDASARDAPHLVAHVLSVPGHTAGHAWYALAPAGLPLSRLASGGDLVGWEAAPPPSATAERMLGGADASVAANDAEAQVSAPCILFSGDTLFVGGVGKFFEGTASQMVRNLYDIAGAGNNPAHAAVPRNTIVCTGHEYAQPNLAFVTWLLPRSAAVADKAAWVNARRAGAPPRATPVTTLDEECRFNPFMRCHSEEVLNALALLNESVIAAASAASDCEVHESAALVRRVVQSPPNSPLRSDRSVLVASMSLLRALKDAEVHLKFEGSTI